MARATLDSVMQEITPFDKGKPLGDGWYSKDLPVRDPAAPDGSGGLKRINSCPGIADGMAGGAGAAGAGVAPAQKSGFVAAVARALRGAHRHTQSAAVPSSLDVVPLSVAVQALYAPVDQVRAHFCQQHPRGVPSRGAIFAQLRARMFQNILCFYTLGFSRWP